MAKIIVTVRREVTETWHYVFDSDAIGIPPNSENLDPEAQGNARQKIYDTIHGGEFDELDESLNDSHCSEFETEHWCEIDA